MVGMDDTEPKKPADIMGKLSKGVIITVMKEAGIPWALALGNVKGRECTGTVKELYQQYAASGWQEIDGMADSVDEISGWILSRYQQIAVT